MAGYDPITELSDSPYPEMRMVAFDSPMVAHDPPDRYLARMRGHGYDIPEHTGSGSLEFINRQNLGTDADGHRHVDFFGDFYNRILFAPNAVSFGNILSTSTQRLDLWNAYLEPREITDYVEPVVEGLTVSEPVDTPYTLAPLEEIEYVITASTSGPPQFAEEINWTIDEESYVAEITGQRVLLWPFPPNWGENVSERLSWMTDVITAFDGTEQRFELRSKPRREIEYTSMLHGNSVNHLKNLLFGWQNRKYALPIWHDKAAVTGALEAGGTSIPVPTEGRSFVEGGFAVVLKDEFNYEVVEIDNVVSDSITLTSPLEKDWPARVRVYPVNLAILPTSVDSQRPTANTIIVQTNWRSDPVETDPYIPDVPAAETYGDDYEVIYRKPNWAKSPDDVALYDYSLNDYDVGAFQQVPKEAFPRQRRQYQWVVRNRADMVDFRALLGRLKGRNTPVYVPTWFADFYLYDVIGANSSTMKIHRQDYDFRVGVRSTQNTILVRLRSGSRYLRTIVGTSESSEDYESINVDESFPEEIKPDDVQMISLVHLMRLDSDAVTINYVSNSVSTIEMTMITVNG